MTKSVWTASCLIIGDEILSGKTQDTNSHSLAQFLFELGIELKRIEVVPDDEQAIAIATKQLSATHDFVFTSGGIGTHDDITYSSIAKAFDLTMELDKETWGKVQQLRQRQQTSTTSPSSLDGYKRMATFPSPSQQIRSDKKLPIPVVVVNNNVYILPGIPRLFRTLLHSPLSDHLKSKITTSSSPLQPFHRRQVTTRQSETRIAHDLTQLQHKVQADGIKIGSYPAWNDATGVKVVISIVGKDRIKVDQVAKLVVDQLDGTLVEAKL
ncbi:putative molybdopterin binding domain-containing protein [Chlamydoabsidia padenii]|nr:putative molybdopterin binding domain-containing protein [Chlamydoabsidia padenii]